MDPDSKLNFFEFVDDKESCSVIEQYASDVRSFSSQYGSEISISYTAYNICGKPSKFPAYGDFPQTFVMVGHHRKEMFTDVILIYHIILLLHIPCTFIVFFCLC